MKHFTKFLFLTFLLFLGNATVWSNTIKFDFEDDGAHRPNTNNSYSQAGNSYKENNVDISLKYADAVKTGTPLNGNANVLGRVAKSTKNSPIIKIGSIPINGTITSITYLAKGVATMTMTVEYSTDNSSWTELQSYTMSTTSETKSISNLSLTVTDFYLRFKVTVPTTTSSNRDFQLDDIEITYSNSALTSDLALTDSPVALSFDLYNNSNEQIINYTTSSTGTVSVSGGEGYVTTSVDATNKTITVTPTAVTTEAQTITVNQAADATYDAGSATFTVTITDSTPITPSTEEWVETPITDLTSSDVFVIVGNNGNNYAMTNDNGTSNPPAATGVTVEGNKITSTVADNLKWNISGNATDGYTFYPNGSTTTWLYCTNTNNGVRVGINDGKTFIIEEGGYLQHNATSRYVGIYNSQDWRCYTSSGGNIADQTFKFYKKVADSNLPNLSAEDVNIAYNAESGSIAYTLTNPVDGGTLTATSSEDWVTIGTVGESSIPFTTSANNTATPRTATVTLTYTYNTDETVTESVTITQAANPNIVYTVTYIDGGSETEASGGAGVTLATRPDLGNYIFAGWCETNVPEETTTAPTIISTSETYHPTADITLYPIYTRTDESSESVPSAFSVGNTGNYAIVCEQEGKYYALPTNPTVENGKIDAEEITVSEKNGVKYITTANANGFTWTIAEAAYGYTLSDGSNYIYHSNGGVSDTNLAYGNNTEFTWSFTIDGVYVKMFGMNNANSNNNRGLMFNNNLVIGGYSLSNWDNAQYHKTMILPISSSTTYYWSNPAITITFQKQNTSMYYSAYNLTVPEDVIAKTYKVANGKPVISKTYQAGETIAKATAVILTLPDQPSNAANLGLTKEFRLASTGVADEENKLVGWDEATLVSSEYPAEEYIAYVLSTKNGDNPGFYYMSGHPQGDTNFQSGAHKAVFPVLKSEASSSKSAWLFSEIDDEVTGISDASITNNEERAEHNGVYNLQGRKVADNLSSILSHPSSQKGIYIVNGKKVIIK